MPPPPTSGYEPVYRAFDSPLLRQVRREAYGEDIGQHSWVTADELRGDIHRLGLGPDQRALDLGCGPGGPLTFLVREVGCRGTGVDRSDAALDLARARATALGVGDRLELLAVDLDGRLPFADGSFGAAVSLDVLPHLADRAAFFAEVARVLAPGGRILVMDASVLTGAISAIELAHRAANGPFRVVPSGFNEDRLARAGLTLLEREDRTQSAVRNARGRLSAMNAHRAELETLMGADEVARQLEYLETVVELSERRVLSRMMYLAERPAARGAR
jgi:SAM-dependent methyltransferase